MLSIVKYTLQNFHMMRSLFFSHIIRIGPWNNLPFSDGALESMNAFKKTGPALRANPHSCTIKKQTFIQLFQCIGY